jgi:hypothetical protein
MQQRPLCNARIVFGIILILLVPQPSNGQDNLDVAALDVQPPQAKDPVLVFSKRYLNVRRGLIKRSCQLTEDEIKGLDAVEDDWIGRELAKGNPKQGDILQNGVAMFLGRPAGRVDVNDVASKVKRLQSLLDKKLFEPLSEQHRKQVQEAIEDMERFEREAISQVLVTKMDEILVLTAEQCDALEPKLANWLTGKSLYIEFYTQQRNYLPKIPASVVKDVLSREQQKLFDATPKHDCDYLTYVIQMFQHQPPQVDRDY